VHTTLYHAQVLVSAQVGHHQSALINEVDQLVSAVTTQHFRLL